MDDSRPRKLNLGVNFSVESDVQVEHTRILSSNPKHTKHEPTNIDLLQEQDSYIPNVDGQQNSLRVFGHNSAPWIQRCTRIGGNDSYEPPKTSRSLGRCQKPHVFWPEHFQKTSGTNPYMPCIHTVLYKINPRILTGCLGFLAIFLGLLGPLLEDSGRYFRL